MKDRSVLVGLLVGLLVTAAFETLPADDDAALLKQAQALFKPLPPTMGTADRPIAPARVAPEGCSSSTRDGRWRET
jgi:hypothetical protein